MKINNEAKVGLMITASFTIFITLVAILAQINVAQKGYKLRIYYSFLNDLRVGAPVKIAGGIKIGQVESISQSGEKTEVSVWIEKKYTLIRATKFAIFTSGLIGEKYINVFVPPSSQVDEFLQDGDKVYGIDPASFDQMMLTFQSFMQDESGGEVLAEIFQNSKKFVENLNKISEENRYDIRKSILSARAMIALTSKQIYTFMINLNKISKHVADLTEENKEDISVTLRNLSETSTNLNKVIFRIEKGKGTLGKLVTEEEIYDNLKDASVSAKALFRTLEKNPSKLFFTPEK
ncbi:MAG TPA: MlaD family protein [Spirochaetota bacterium]|nr:MlaD family protein [Spirochaetota bacterium]HPI89634.1 MlaD family protein [Spirochaetota bacterium]HPR49213.1 MlaD family protein [Spirochaetota bacterium]